MSPRSLATGYELLLLTYRELIGREGRRQPVSSALRNGMVAKAQQMAR